jgi:hypothetical protein
VENVAAQQDASPFDPKGFKDVEIKGRRYRIDLISAFDGDWIAQQVTTGNYSEPVTYRRCQELLLASVSVYESVRGGAEIPMRIFGKGQWLVPGLTIDRDIMALRGLVTAALDFNLGPFFDEAKREFLASQQKPKDQDTTQ